MDQLWEFHYGLLSEAEAAALGVRLEQEPEVAAAYGQVQRAANRIAQAAKIVPRRSLVFSIPKANQENDDTEKKTVSPPPDLPEEIAEITGNFSAVLESLPSSSLPVQPSKPNLSAASVRRKSQAARNPFVSRFSPQHVRLNRILTIGAIFLLILTLTGFSLIRQTQILLTHNLLQIQVVMPNVLARQTQNTLSIKVSDWQGLPKQVPVRVSLLSELGEKIALYQEKTDSQGSLHLALETPEELSANAFVEIAAGEEKTMQTVRQMIPVVDRRKQQPEALAREVSLMDSFPSESAHSLASSGHPYAPFYQNTQNAARFPASNALQDRGMAGRGGMGGGMESMEKSRGMGMGGTAARMSALIPTQTSLPFSKELEVTESYGQEFETDFSEAAEDSPEPNREVELVLPQKEFDSTQPVQFQVRSPQPGRPLIASVSRQGIPLAQFPVKTPQSPGTLAAIDVPENDSLTGLLQITLFDPVANPVKELVSESVFRRGNRFLKIEKVEKVEKAGESRTLPTAIKITDEKGMPTVAEVRFSRWKGDAPQTEAIPSPVLLDNQRQFHAELESARSKHKPVFSEMLVFFTASAVFGGVILAGVILVLFFLRRLSGYVPLIFASVTGTTCVLLGVALMHDQQQFPMSASTLEKSALNATQADLEEEPKSVVSEMYEQWAAESDSQGICPLNLTEWETPSTLQMEALTSDQREGFVLWEIP